MWSDLLKISCIYKNRIKIIMYYDDTNQSGKKIKVLYE